MTREEIDVWLDTILTCCVGGTNGKVGVSIVTVFKIDAQQVFNMLDGLDTSRERMADWIEVELNNCDDGVGTDES